LKTTENLLLKPILAEKDIGSAVFRIYGGGIYYVQIKRGIKVSMEFVKEGYAFLDDFGGGEFYNIYEFGSFADVEPDVREWAASPSNNSYTKVDAIVISSFPQKIIADFYIRFNKPVKPTKVFSSLKSAVDWIQTFEEN
jgi:hypothetical protein